MKKKHWKVSVFDKTNETIRDDTFYTTDTEVYLTFELIDEDFIADSATVTLYNIYGTVIINACVDIVDGTVQYEMPVDAIGHIGGWRTQVVFTKDNEDYTTKIIEFDVGGHLLDNKKTPIFVIENWNHFVKHAGNLVDDWEQLEKIRQANERKRERSESRRQNEFETNEGERESTFEINESIRHQHAEERYGQLEEEYAPKLTEVTAQLAQTERELAVFTELIESEEVSKIRLIGDSITYGTGASGLTPPTSDNREIVVRQGTMRYEANEDYDSWANLFKEYVREKHPEVDVFNAGIPGITTVEADSLKQDLIPEVDILIIMLGTNDILQTSSLSEFETHMRNLLAYGHSKSKQMIVISPTPSLNDFEDEDESVLNSSRNFPLKDVDRVITSICVENGYFHISMFKEILKFVSNTGIKLKDTLNDNLHPNDYGHSLFFGILQTKLGFVKTTKSMTVLNSLSDNKPYLQQDTELDSIFNKPIHDYEINKIHYAHVYTNYQDFPTGDRGLLETFRANSEVFSYQVYRPLHGTDVYTRFWTESGWGDFFRGETFREFNATISTPISSFPVNTITYKYVPYSQRLGFPEDSAGLLVTYKAREAYSYQEYHPLKKNRVYKRFVNDDGSWSDFELVGGVL